MTLRRAPWFITNNKWWWWCGGGDEIIVIAVVVGVVNYHHHHHLYNFLIIDLKVLKKYFSLFFLPQFFVIQMWA